MQVADFLQLLTQIEPKKNRNPLENNSTIFPSDVLEVLLEYVGGLLQSTLPNKIFIPSSSFHFASTWLKPSQPVYHALPQLLRRRFCRVETIVGRTTFETFGFYCPETDSVFSRSAPFVMSDNFRFTLTVSSDHYSVANILTNSQKHNSCLLCLLLCVIYPNLQEWLARNLDEHSQFPERNCGTRLKQTLDLLGLDFDFDCEDSLTPKDLLKHIRVGKFRKRRKFSRLKKRRRLKVQGVKRSESREKKRKRPKKTNRVHKKRLSCT